MFTNCVNIKKFSYYLLVVSYQFIYDIGLLGTSSKPDDMNLRGNILGKIVDTAFVCHSSGCFMSCISFFFFKSRLIRDQNFGCPFI